MNSSWSISNPWMQGFQQRNFSKILRVENSKGSVEKLGEEKWAKERGCDATLSRRALNFPRLNRSDVSSLCLDRVMRRKECSRSLSFIPRQDGFPRGEMLFSFSPPLSLSFEKQKDRDGGNALIRFIPSSHRLWSYFPEISLLGTSSPHFFISLLTALFYLKSISLLTKPFRPTFNAIRNTFSHLWRIYSKVQSSFFSKEMLNKQTNRIWSLDYYVALYYHFDSMLTSSC